MDAPVEGTGVAEVILLFVSSPDSDRAGVAPIEDMLFTFDKVYVPSTLLATGAWTEIFESIPWVHSGTSH